MQITQGFLHAVGGRRTRINVVGAAVVKRHVEHLAAGCDVVPRCPVDQHRWFVAHIGKAVLHHLLVRTQHALCLDDCFGRSCGARGEEEFCYRVGTGR